VLILYTGLKSGDGGDGKCIDECSALNTKSTKKPRA
jgi:hypothetical protein